MESKGSKWPVIPFRGRLPNGMEVKIYIVPMEGGSLICDEFGQPLCMKDPGVKITPEFLERAFRGAEE